MAYAAVISLKQTLCRLLNSCQISCIAFSTRELMESAYNHVISSQQILKKLDSCSRGNLNMLEELIRDEAQKLEDLLEFHESDHFLAQSQREKPKKRMRESESCQDCEEIRQGIKSFCEAAANFTTDFVSELGHLSSEEEDGDDEEEEAAASDLTIVADPFDYADIKLCFLRRRRPDDFGVFQLTGELGSGITIASAAIFEDLKHCFDCRARVTVGPKYERREILLCILAQINEPNELVSEELGDGEIGECLYASLKGRRYLIVADDIRDVEIWNFLEKFFPVEDNGSAVLITTSLNRLLRIPNSFLLFDMASRNFDNWWNFFEAGMFGIDSESCPPEFEEAGKKIVANCRSLSIPLVKVMLLLLKAGKLDIEYWKELAEDKLNPIFMVDDELFEIRRIEEEIDGNSCLDEEKEVLLLDLIDFSFYIKTIKMEMFPERFFPKMMTVSFLGMAGIGKTSLVKEMFQDPSIRCHFDHHVWVELGPEYEYEEILGDILVQIYPNIDKEQVKGNEDLGNSLCTELLDKKCLVVLDDVWSRKPLDYMKYSFPDFKGTILVTTRLAKVAQNRKDDIWCKMRLSNRDESWDLFCENLFGEETCPSHLKKAGEKIVENCEGLPLMIVTVANLLSNVEKTIECWSDVAQKNSSIFMAAYEQISKILVPSYEYLPQYLKICFLYIGIFPQNKMIQTSKLVNFWIAEGFLEPNIDQRIEDFSAECLSELDNGSLVMVGEKGSNFRIKTCSLHCVFWHLSNSVAIKNKFFHALSTLADTKVEDMSGHRRLCIRNSTLLGIQDVQDSIASTSAARSLLCTAPSHQYPVPVSFDLRLLRLMDALSIRLYEFPIEVVELHYLRYLGLTYSGNLPPSISKLWNLQFLIVGRQLSIKSSTESPDLPMEIWDMEELQHLHVEGCNLQNPSHGVVLPNLSTLVGVSAQSCSEEVLEGVPNLKRLGIQIELEPDENSNSHFHFLNHVSHLRGLESLKCVVLNPDFTPGIVSPPIPHSMFPSSLKKLSLSGLGYPWEYMKIISKLENLEVLKLRCYAFQGEEWKIEDSRFKALRFLLIEDTDLVRWRFTTASIVHLKCLCIKHCYQLEELPLNLPGIEFQTLEVVDCNPFVEKWAKELEEDVTNSRNFSSWDARKLETAQLSSKA